MLALALAMGKTRVFSMTWSGPPNNAIFKDAGVNLENHKMTHEIKSIPKSERPVMQHKIVRLSMAHLGHLAKQLMGYTVGAGTLLDRCAILATSELSAARGDVRRGPLTYRRRNENDEGAVRGRVRGEWRDARRVRGR